MSAKRNFVLAGVALVAAGCKEQAPPRDTEVRPVRTSVVNPRPIEDDRSAVGEIKPRYESDLGFRVSGKLVSRLADVGASIRSGEVLARLEEQDYRNKLRSAEADVAAAEASLVESQAAEGRLRALVTSGVTPRASYDTAVKNLRSAEAKLNSARASLDLARDQLTYTELRADFDGIVTVTGAENGQIVNVGQMVVRLAKPVEKDAVFAIAESVFRSRPAEPPEVVVSLLSNPGIAADGIVREVSPVADPTTRTYQVKVTLRAPPEAMRFGASILGRLKTMAAPVVVLPGTALFDKGGQPAVWIVDVASSEVSLKPVKVNRYEADRIVIGEGLAKGEIVVTAGVNRLREKQVVRLIDGEVK